MSFKETCIKVMAGLTLAGTRRLSEVFAYWLSDALSVWEPIDPAAYEWSIDLISDTHLIVPGLVCCASHYQST